MLFIEFKELVFDSFKQGNISTAVGYAYFSSK